MKSFKDTVITKSGKIFIFIKTNNHGRPAKIEIKSVQIIRSTDFSHASSFVICRGVSLKSIDSKRSSREYNTIIIIIIIYCWWFYITSSPVRLFVRFDFKNVHSVQSFKACASKTRRLRTSMGPRREQRSAPPRVPFDPRFLVERLETAATCLAHKRRRSRAANVLLSSSRTDEAARKTASGPARHTSGVLKTVS